MRASLPISSFNASRGRCSTITLSLHFDYFVKEDGIVAYLDQLTLNRSVPFEEQAQKLTRASVPLMKYSVPTCCQDRAFHVWLQSGTIGYVDVPVM